jgi:uncharacterized protein (TIGR02453 family)
MAPAPTFRGFPARAFNFLRGLAEINNKPWFDAHRKDYDEALIGPARALVGALGPRLQEISPEVGYDPRINGSILRLNRDVRFSTDKTPYKTHLDLWIWVGGEKGWSRPGFFYRMMPDRLILGAGMHHLEKDPLDRYRAAVADEASGGSLTSMLERIQAAGPYSVGGEGLKRVPRGYPPDHPRAGLLKHVGLFVWTEGPIPGEAYGLAFVDYCLSHFAALEPVNEWMARWVAVSGQR